MSNILSPREAIMNSAPYNYPLDVSKEIGLIVAQVIDDTVSQGNVFIAYNRESCTPVVTFSDPDNLTMKSEPLAELIVKQLEFYNYEEEAKQSSEYRLLIHIQSALASFINDESSHHKDTG